MNRDLLLGLIVLILLVLVALCAPLLAPHDPHAFTGQPLERPSMSHPLGTNDVGQDILSELIYGTRISLLVAIGAAVGTVGLGSLVGCIAGYAGGWIDRLMMGWVDLLLALPRLPLLILLAAFLGAGLGQTTGSIALLFWPGTARVIRTRVQVVRRRTYIRLAHGFGGSTSYALRRHILPEIAPLVIAELVTTAGQAVAMEAGLAFLGLGNPMAKSWGLMLRFALNLPGLLLTDRWMWWLLPPGICITLLVLALTFIGTGLEGHFLRRPADLTQEPH